MSDLLTIKETARRLGIGRSTLCEWIRERGFPVQCITEHRRACSWDDVERWIAEQASLAAPSEPGRRLRYARGSGWAKLLHRTTL